MLRPPKYDSNSINWVIPILNYPSKINQYIQFGTNMGLFAVSSDRGNYMKLEPDYYIHCWFGYVNFTEISSPILWSQLITPHQGFLWQEWVYEKLKWKEYWGLNYKPILAHARPFPTLWLYSVPHAYCWNVDAEIPAQCEDQRITFYGIGVQTHPKKCELARGNNI